MSYNNIHKQFQTTLNRTVGLWRSGRGLRRCRGPSSGTRRRRTVPGRVKLCVAEAAVVLHGLVVVFVLHNGVWGQLQRSPQCLPAAGRKSKTTHIRTHAYRQADFHWNVYIFNVYKSEKSRSTSGTHTRKYNADMNKKNTYWILSLASRSWLVRVHTERMSSLYLMEITAPQTSLPMVNCPPTMASTWRREHMSAPPEVGLDHNKLIPNLPNNEKQCPSWAEQSTCHQRDSRHP